MILYLVYSTIFAQHTFLPCLLNNICATYFSSLLTEQYLRNILFFRVYSTIFAQISYEQVKINCPVNILISHVDLMFKNRENALMFRDKGGGSFLQNEIISLHSRNSTHCLIPWYYKKSIYLHATRFNVICNMLDN